MPDARRTMLVACAAAVSAYPGVLVGESLAGSTGWLAAFYSLLSVWLVALVFLVRAERRLSYRLVLAVSIGLISFGIQVPGAFALTAWSLNGFAP